MNAAVTPVNIAGRLVGPGHPAFCIAEIGANFSSLAEGLRLIDAAAAAGCDGVKVQTFSARTLVRDGAMFTFEDGSRVSQYDFFKARELDLAAHRQLKERADGYGVAFFSTPSHGEDLALLELLQPPVHKIGSDDLTNLPFIQQVAAKGRPVILSTGMCTLSEIREAVAAVAATGNRGLILLHCLVGYPAPIGDANLRLIPRLQQEFGVPIGFSDHTLGTEAAPLAVATGAVVIEKHFTLDRSPGGPDNDTSLEPHEFAEMVRAIRRVESILGDGEKTIRDGERKWREAARKSLVAARPIAVGEVVSRDMIAIKRPGDGLAPRHLADLLGRHVRVAIEADACIRWDHLEPAE